MVRQPKGVAAALAELAFISNPAEADLLADPDVQRVEGEAVARGIIRFLTTADAGSGYVEGGNMAPRPRSIMPGSTSGIVILNNTSPFSSATSIQWDFTR